MNRSRPRIAALVAAATAAAGVAGYLTIPTASANVDGPYFATQGVGSNPDIIRCVHPESGHNGYCLFTSKDLGSGGYPPANYYPSKTTRLYYSPNGHSHWEDKGIVARERDLPWVPDDAHSQGAPAATKKGGYYYLYVPNVSNISNGRSTPNIHTSSRVGVWRAASAFGPYEYQGVVTLANGADGGYMGDPDIFEDGSRRYLIWADGDDKTCGGLKSGILDSSMRTVTGVKSVQLDLGWFNEEDDCVPAAGGESVGRPYLHGASVYKFGGTSMPGPYTMVFTVSPATRRPPEIPFDHRCDVELNTEVIAYATADSPQGPYDFRGTIMCGSSTEWTNQATIMQVEAFDDRRPWAILYHDGPAKSDADGDYVEPQRRLHAECLFAGNGVIPRIHRQPLDAPYGFNDCVGDGAFAFSALKVGGVDAKNYPLLSIGSNDITAMASEVGVNERFKLHQTSNGQYVIQSLANKKYLCTRHRSIPLRARCTDANSTNARFTFEFVPDGTYFYIHHDALDRYVGFRDSGDALYADHEASPLGAMPFSELRLG
jgi:hypothetical protein